jgi:hypothetical protein
VPSSLSSVDNRARPVGNRLDRRAPDPELLDCSNCGI